MSDDVAELSGDVLTVKAQNPGDSFSFGGETFTADDLGFVEAPVEAIADIASFGFFPAECPASDLAPPRRKKSNTA